MNTNKINSEVTHSNFPLEKVLKELAGESGIGLTGNVYYVILSTKAYLTDFLNKYQQKYSDGTMAVQVDTGNGLGIQAAITASYGGRSDYILVMPGSYQLTTALTMVGKSSLHLIGVNGGGVGVGCVGAALLQQTGAYQNLILEAYDEVAGFQFINKSGYSAITMADAKWRANVHHNYFHVVQGAAASIIACAGSGMSHGFICNNRFSTWFSGALTSHILIAGGSSIVISNNLISNSLGTVDTGINVGSSGQTIVMDNVIMDCGGLGTFTAGIQANPTSCLIGNRFALQSGTAIAGGLPDRSFVDNRDALAGGAVVIET